MCVCVREREVGRGEGVKERVKKRRKAKDYVQREGGRENECERGQRKREEKEKGEKKKSSEKVKVNNEKKVTKKW